MATVTAGDIPGSPEEDPVPSLDQLHKHPVNVSAPSSSGVSLLGKKVGLGIIKGTLEPRGINEGFS